MSELLIFCYLSFLPIRGYFIILMLLSSIIIGTITKALTMNKMLIASLSSVLLLSGCAEVNNESAGTVAGGVIGGLLGSQFGGGSGKVAATIGGAVIGSLIGGNIGRNMDARDQAQMQRALETAPTGKPIHWKNPDNGNQYTVKSTRTFYHDDQACREYTTNAIIGGKTEQIVGKACRQSDGSWKVIN